VLVEETVLVYRDLRWHRAVLVRLEIIHSVSSAEVVLEEDSSARVAPPRAPPIRVVVQHNQ
jgi:hypothetical protein